MGTVLQFPEDVRGPPRWQGWRMSTLPDNAVPIYGSRRNRDLDSGEVLALAILEALSRKKGFQRFFSDDVMHQIVSGPKGHRGREIALHAFFDRHEFFGEAK